ncbi:hypothetical protein E4U42_003823 [Claviceps africana]|uniref:RING-type domain-containing protein n=1 Tax=Claviceps africana TaxID=83212 RepID=A0A8K0J643_9HYPO|nr:hypothetical protein E4U42_003823 [Claviceps africana]
MSHSKRNTSRAVFTSHERALAKASWSSNSARLNRDSYLPFGSCSLCLEIARDPVACPLGDIFCRECALANLLAQKKELKRAEKARRHASEEDARAKIAKESEDQQRAVRDFELIQAGLAASGQTTTAADSAAPELNGALLAGTKRKFILDEDELARIAKEDRLKARKAIESEKAGKPTLPSFWTPSLTPDVKDNQNLRAVNLEAKAVPICPSSPDDSPHAISMHRLVTIQFQEDEENSKNGKRRSCPSCLKTLTNSSSPVMMQQCGHVMCLSCVKRLLISPKTKEGVSASPASEPPMVCYVCDSPVLDKSATQTQPQSGTTSSSLPKGLVLLKSEGTGFSARGSNTVEKSGVGFQC